MNWKVLLIAIMNAIKEEQIDEELEGLSLLINECEKIWIILFLRLSKKKNKRKREENNRIKKSSIGSKIGAAVNEIFIVMCIHRLKLKKKKVEAHLKINNIRIQLHWQNPKTQLEYIYKILDNISNVNVVVIYDELDKWMRIFWEFYFRNIKNYLWKRYFNFFVVNDTIYKNIVIPIYYKILLILILWESIMFHC